MRLQGRALQAGMAGEDIAVLHRELTALGYEIPADERDSQLFGVGTAAVVAQFQRAHGHRDTAMVDEATAAAMEQVLTSPAAETVVTPRPVPAKPAPAEPAAAKPTPAEPPPAEPAPAHGRAKVGHDQGSAPADEYRVAGRVASRVSAAVGGLRVVVVDKQVGGETPLAEAITDPGGDYEVSLSRADLRQRCAKDQPDLQARVFSGERFLAASEVRYNASARETLHVRLDEPASRALPSEYETLTAALTARHPGSLGALQEADDRQDLTYLAHKSGWDARAIAMAALADRFSAETADTGTEAGIEPAFFYALLRAGLPAFRAGLPAQEAAVYRTDPATVEATWNRAAEQGLIPASLRDRVPAAVERFTRIAAQRLLEDPPPAGLSSFKELLTLALGDDAQRQQRFADLYARHGGDRTAFWDEVRGAFGETTANRLRLDGQLAYLTLNNARLIGRLHEVAGQGGLTDTSQLVELGFYRAGRWRQLIGEDPVPPEVPGEDDAEQRDRYAELLAAYPRLSHPTAVVAQMVKRFEIPVANEEARDAVHAFLSEHAGRFELGRLPVVQYLARNDLQVDPAVTREVTRIQRVWQITPGDEAMNGLLQHGVDSAQAVVRYGRDEFVQVFKDLVGGERNATLVHAKAQQVNATVLNLTTTYLAARSAPAIGVHSPASIVDPRSSPPANVDDIPAYPTLESLVDKLDYCTCQHCRSILSPAAYLVDLLMFIDQPVTEASADFDNPQQVLQRRRPDLWNLPLTCENTNIPLPYIDVVNEILEHYVVNGRLREDYPDRNTDASVPPDELLASPQFVSEGAYRALAEGAFPPPLPFHQTLENLRRYFRRFAAPLPEVMAALRIDDRLDRGNEVYGWRDIWMETLGLSRAEHKLLTSGGADVMRTVKQLYGFGPDDDVLAVLGGAKSFSRRVGISYQELVEILRTRFVNPYSRLLPRLERLRVSFATLKALKDGAITDEEFEEMLPAGLDPAQYPGGVTAWVTDDDNYRRIMSLVTLTVPDDPEELADPEDVCSFDNVKLRYADGEELRPFEFVRLIRFIRLWRKLGWSIEETDQAIAALYPAAQAPEHSDEAVNLERLDAGFLDLLLRLGVMRRVMDQLRLTPKRDLLPLLACFARLDTHGESSLYRRMFLGPSRLDDAFADDGYGNYLVAESETLLAHAATLRAAFSLTADELGEITAALGYDDDTALTIDTISAVFRRGWLARTLRLSVRELLGLIRLTGLDPFEPPDPVRPAIVRLVELVGRVRALGVTPAQMLYLIWNQDLSGMSAPPDAEITALARTLRGALRAVESEYALVDDPDGSIARARMAQAYGSEATDLFFGLLDNTFVTEVEYDHGRARLERSILDADPERRIGYDDFRKRLSYAGVLTEATQEALKEAVGATDDFRAKADELYAENQAVVGPFFDRFPKLKQGYQDYVASTEPDQQRRTALLEALLPELKRRRKQQQALQSASTAADASLELASALLADPAVLHAADPAGPALDDLTTLENTPGGGITGGWAGYLEAPENGPYNVSIVTDPAATVQLTVDGVEVPLSQDDGRWRNTAPLDLRAGTLYEIAVDGPEENLVVRWQTASRGSEVIPARYLYPVAQVDNLRHAYLRFRKAAALAAALGLTPAEMAHLAAHADYQVDGEGWLSRLPVMGSTDLTTARRLHTPVDGLLDFARLKADLSPDDERLLQVLRDPQTTTADEESLLLYDLTRWELSSLNDLLNRFGLAVTDLAHLQTFVRVYDAYGWVKKLGVPAASLILATTNEPKPAAVRDLQAALRARHDESGWLAVLRPINDEMRSLQRDALVAHILHRMRSHLESAHIDTPEKLYEYFLMDVQMDPCMLTSRIRHAISSVQLFVERCLMNLEQHVSPKSFNAKQKQWEWMKRYRVWEANRKVFLFPENWLEPELRHDQSPIFKETMSELLQGDITEERAVQALVGYLTKLDEVAKLEVCGVHYEEGGTGTADEVVHVVARTAGANRKYFYRRLEYGSWTPWEKIDLNIEDNPVIPVVWNNRLLLFWLKIIQKEVPRPQPRPPDDKPLGEVKPSDVLPGTGPSMVWIQAILNWSEQIGGEWQPARTSDPSAPQVVGAYEVWNGQPTFDRATLELSTDLSDDGLLIIMSTQVNYGWPLGLTNFRHPAFKLYSAPGTSAVNASTDTPPSPRSLDTDGRHLEVSYSSSDDVHRVLKNEMDSRHDRATAPSLLMDREPWEPPFFYEDKRHAFYVTTRWRINLGDIRKDFGIGFGFRDWDFDIRGTTVRPDGLLVEAPPATEQPRLGEEPQLGDAGPVLPLRYITEDADINVALWTIGTIPYGDRDIGPSGSQPRPGGMQ